MDGLVDAAHAGVRVQLQDVVGVPAVEFPTPPRSRYCKQSRFPAHAALYTGLFYSYDVKWKLYDGRR